MASLKIPLRVGTPAKRVDVFHMLCGLLFLFRYHTTTAWKLRPLFNGVVIPFPFFSYPFGGAALLMWPQETVMKKKKIRWKGELTDRRTKDWSAEVMTDGLRNAKEMMDHLAAAWWVPLT